MRLDIIRQRWLLGESLRKIASDLGITHTKLYSRLKAEYGEDVCDLSVHSLQRSLLRDYRNKPEMVEELLAFPFPGEISKVYGARGDNVWSTHHQRDNGVLDAIQYKDYEPESEPLRLPYLLFVLEATTKIIEACINGFLPDCIEETQDSEG